MEKELACLRSIIADCDERITAALKTRMECIEGIITYKRENGLPVLQPEQEKNSATAEKPVRYGKGKKTKSAEPVQQPGLLRQWLPPIVAGIAMMAACGAASRVIFGFLF